MRKARFSLFILAVAWGLALFAAQAAAAARPGAQNPPQRAKKEAPQSVNVYRVNYRVSEVQNGKTVNARSYTLMAKTSAAATIRVGSRIALKYPQDSHYQLYNVGMDLSCSIAEKEDNLILHTKVDMSNIAETGQGDSTPKPPVVRDVRLEDDTAVMLGKPALVGSIDDVYSNRRYQVEVTVTRAK